MSFVHAEGGMTRFPPNVEQIRVVRETSVTWLVVRQNNTTIRFPLSDVDCAHLACLLTPDAAL